MDLKWTVLSGHVKPDYLSLSYPLYSPGYIVQPHPPPKRSNAKIIMYGNIYKNISIIH